MKRTLTAGMNIWRQKGILWPFFLLTRAIKCVTKSVPRGLIVEPSQGCTGNCAGCYTPDKPAVLRADLLETWLETSPAKPVTIHFSGKHSDPLASPEIDKLADTAGKNCSMLSVSTIGLGLRQAHVHLPVDRWIFSIPAATEKSWEMLRGNKRFNEAIKAIRTVRQNSRAMVEVVLTLWKASVNDIETFNQLAEKENWQHTKIVFGRFDPEGNHFGRLENIALDHEASPYILTNDSLALKKNPQGCPLAGYLFLDATGTLRPCPFTGDESPHTDTPDRKSWNAAKKWLRQKQNREYTACTWCP
ncbi:MAG: radical SAM protein [Candidatus Fermentibacteria bacterium]|nr:radical SAM protein [Candidatus Fermentibacteria bacterium]